MVENEADSRPTERRISMRLTLALCAVMAITLPTTVLGSGGAAAGPATAASPHMIKMLNYGASGMMVFEPNLLRIKPGDSVTFIPADMGHNVESITGMLPAGATPFKGSMSKALTVTFSKPGIYGFKCGPHAGMGMVGVIVVGNKPNNLAQAEAVSLPGRAKQVMTSLLARVR
jgi:pseudoazurin